MKVLTFSIAELRVGVDIAFVVEAVRAVEITPLPGAPAVVEGLIDFRGSVAPVFDMRLRLLNSHTDIVPDDRLIVARAAGRLVALHVEAVSELVDVDSRSVQSATSTGATLPHIDGVATQPDGLLLIHDLATFLSAAERDTLDAALAGAGVTR